MSFHGYCGIENLSLSPGQKATLVAAIRGLGPASHPNPSHRNHSRVRLDGNAVIFHAEFADADLTPATIGHRLALIFGVPDASVTWTIANPTFAVRPSPVVTYRYLAADKVRLTAFGGLASTWPQSRTEVLAYLSANQAAWEGSA